MEDEGIVRLFLDKKEEAIAYTKSKYGKVCMATIARILSDQRDAEECEGDVYLKMWETIPPAKPKVLRAYLIRVARNVALDRYRYNSAKQRNTALTEAFEELEFWLPTSEKDPGEQIDENHFRQVINDFLREQSADARRFFLKRYWYGESVREIAASCGVSEAKVKTSLFRTREKLRDRLMKERIEI